MSQQKNPIQRRLDLINDNWVEFTEAAQARLLRWLATDDEGKMVEAWLTAEQDEDIGTLPDAFIELRTPFTGQAGHGFAMYEELVNLVRDAEAEEQAPDVSAEGAAWEPPVWNKQESDLELWSRTAQSLAQHFELPALLAFALLPQFIADNAQYQLLLKALADLCPENVRYIVLDDIQEPALTPLADAAPELVISQVLDLDMARARVEASSDPASLETPGGKFRHLFVQLGNALEKKDLIAAESYGKAALAIAAPLNWFAMAVPVHFALGAACGAANRVADALEHYLAAEAAAAAGESAGDANCPQLRVQARMVRGGLLLATKAYAIAAELFTETLPLAQALADPALVLDCLRLAAFGHECEKNFDKAWNIGLEGLAYAKTLDPKQLELSTFPYLGEGLLRVAKQPAYQALGLRVEREMVALLGRADWRPTAHLPETQAQSAS